MLLVFLLFLSIPAAYIGLSELNSYDSEFLQIMMNYATTTLLSLGCSFFVLLIANLGIVWYLKQQTKCDNEFVLNYVGNTCFFVGCGCFFIMPFLTLPEQSNGS
ncbi:putative integral membrane protein [Babesia bovis T2Bo]|uniref:Uncharacterized protein n=1 Tax=Babesia bovis TaxID=5865 RepID=S6AZ24_BABBO|nr:putative integral membrane protein [Babesia bovis T2Bo]KAG6440209.1 putative integral membrane protein [Babesia bovis T2Bo]BAN64238.1 hypothetical protein [Babesia bovis]